MATITIYKDTTREATCVESSDLAAFDDQYMRYIAAVGAAVAGTHSVETDLRSSGPSYSVSDENPENPEADIANAHDIMQSVEFWNC